jgi:hypothetical protein
LTLTDGWSRSVRDHAYTHLSDLTAGGLTAARQWVRAPSPRRCRNEVSDVEDFTRGTFPAPQPPPFSGYGRGSAKGRV